jgi:hypothetical protein
MLSISKRRLATLISVGVVGLVLVLPAGAHNAGHFILPDGTCHQIGSFVAAPLVGQDKTPLDLIPTTPQDEYGTSFAAFQGNTPILPGGCPR